MISASMKKNNPYFSWAMIGTQMLTQTLVKAHLLVLSLLPPCTAIRPEDDDPEEVSGTGDEDSQRLEYQG